MKQSEKTLVGLMLLVGGVAVVALVGLPQWDAFSSNQSQVATLNEEIKALDAQKDSLNAEIVQLEKNTQIPPGIEVQKYNAKNREQIIKGLIDKVVNMATQSGNLFVSLAPADDKSSSPAPAKEEKAEKSGDAEPEAPPPPVLNTFDYDLSFRGTYGSIQGFLRAMTEQKALMEIHTIKLENELGGGGSTSSSTSTSSDMADPFHPIRLTAKLRLALQPVDQ